MNYFHIVAAANQDRPVFEIPEVARDVYLALERVNHPEDGVAVAAYTLMSAHAHLLIGVQRPERLASAVSRVLGPVAQRLNGRLQQRGGVFCRPFWRSPAQSDAHLHILPLYIHANVAPTTTELHRLDVGLRSSHSAWMSGVLPAWLTPGAVLGQYAGGYKTAMLGFLEDRAANAEKREALDGPERFTLLAVAQLTGVRPGTLLDATRGGKRDRMLLAWALGRELGNVQAGKILGVERHTVARWSDAVLGDEAFSVWRGRLGA